MLEPKHELLKVRRKPTEGILSLLKSVTLGTNGAHYRHLDTDLRIVEADDPVFLSLERNDRVLGNVTFCQREQHWYVRYFAFNALLPTSAKGISAAKNSKLKIALNACFDEALSNDISKVDSFYAYIDPRNTKRALLSETMQFEKIGNVITQTFSRRKPKSSSRVLKIDDWEKISQKQKAQYQSHQFYFEAQSRKPPFYIIEDDRGEVLAAAKIHLANWEIKRLPGKFGGVLVKLIPWIPVIRSLIKPKRHSFVVPEGVFVKNNDPELLAELFQGILDKEQRKVMIWWVDPRESIYKNSSKKVKWGLLDKMIGRNTVDVVVRSNSTFDKEKLFYVSGFDFI
jgi:hypothetical protein